MGDRVHFSVCSICQSGLQTQTERHKKKREDYKRTTLATITETGRRAVGLSLEGMSFCL